MEDSKRDEGLEKKMKYGPPELISLDKDNRAEGVATCSPFGSGGNPEGIPVGSGAGVDGHR